MPRENKTIPKILNAVIFIVMEIAALTMLSKSSEIQNIWIAKTAHIFMAKVWGSSENIKRYFDLKKENTLLAQENFELTKKLKEYKDLEERKALEDMVIGAPFAENFIYRNAEIVKISRNKQHNYLIINKGYEDGIDTQSGIITSKGVIGIIDAVSKHYSYALSFMNTETSISARLGKGGVRGGAIGPLIWDGHSSNGAILKEIPLQYKFQPGDTVWTSGYSSIFPPDIPIGITGESKIVNGATNEINVTLFQDYTTLRYVTVVKNLGKDEIDNIEEHEIKFKKQ